MAPFYQKAAHPFRSSRRKPGSRWSSLICTTEEAVPGSLESPHGGWPRKRTIMLSFSDTLAIIGALGLGALLDAAIRAPHKKRVSAWLARMASRAGKISYGGSAFLDRIFGRSILSWRAVPRYALISLASISMSYGFAVLSSAPDVMDAIWIFKDAITPLDLVLLGVCFGAAIVGDIFSYAQTRLFVRAIDRSRSVVISVGLVAADLIVSLSIFFATFSVARLICTLLVLQIPPIQTLHHTESYAPALLAAALAEAQVEVGSDKESISAFAVAIANGRTPIQLAAVADWHRRGVAGQMTDPRSLRHVNFTAERRCVGSTTDGRLESAAAVALTQELFTAVMAEQAQRRPLTADVERIRLGMGEAYYARVGKEIGRPTPSACLVEVTSIEATTTAAAFISAAGPFNALWAAVERTLFDAYNVVGFKLAPYIGFDPYASTPLYFESLKLELQNTLLGAFPVDADRAMLTSYFSEPVKAPRGQVNVPFTPMVASALTTSAFLIIYLLGLSLAAIRSSGASLIQRLLPAFDLERAVFTSISIALVATFVFTAAGIWTLQALWRLLLGYW